MLNRQDFFAELIQKIRNAGGRGNNYLWILSIQLIIAVLLGLFVFPPRPFPTDSYHSYFDSYNDNCKKLKEAAFIQGNIYFSTYGPLILRGLSGSFTYNFKKTSTQQVRIRYKNYPAPRFSFAIKVTGNGGKSYVFQNRFDLFKHPLYLGTLGKSDSFSVQFSGMLSFDSEAQAAYLNDQIEVVMIEPFWSDRLLLLTLSYLGGMAVFVLLSQFALKPWWVIIACIIAQIGLASILFVSGWWQLIVGLEALLFCTAMIVFWRKTKVEAKPAILHHNKKLFFLGLLIAISVNVGIISSRTQNYALAGDTESYVAPARDFWKNRGFPGMIERTPGYPLFIVVSDLFYKKASYSSIVEAQTILFVFLPILTCLVFYIGTGRFWWALLSGFVVCFYLPLWTLPRWVLSEAFTCVCVVISFLLFAQTLRRPSWFMGGITGLAVGFLALVRPTFVLLWFVLSALLLLPVIGSAFSRSERSSFLKRCQSWLMTAGALALGGVLFVAGWSLRNKIQHDYFGLSNIASISVLSHLQYYPRELPSRDDAEKEIKNRLIQLINAKQGFHFSYYKFAEEIHKVLDPRKSDFNSKVTSMFFYFICNHPKLYWQSFKIALSYYLRPLNLNVDDRFEVIMNQTPLLGTVSRLVNESTFFENLLLRPKIYAMLAILSCVVLLISRKDKGTALFLLATLLTVFYVMIVSVVLTRDEQNNPRFQIVVQPLLIGLYFASAGTLVERSRWFSGRIKAFLSKPRRVPGRSKRFMKQKKKNVLHQVR